MKALIVATLAAVSFSLPAFANDVENTEKQAPAAYGKAKEEAKKDAKKDGVIKQKQLTEEEEAEQQEESAEETSY